MKLKILDTKKAEKGSKELPMVFNEPLRTDLIKRAVEALQANARQPYGADMHAGMKSSAKLSRRRRDYKTAYGHGISRSPRKVLSRNGTRFNWVGAFAPNCVSGRQAHPPKAVKIWDKKINIKENRKAIRSAIAATVVKSIVEARGHALPEGYPFIISKDFDSLSKTKLVYDAMIKLGLDAEMERAEEKTIKSGKARLRGRHYRKRKGPLFVFGKDCPFLSAACNIPGVDAVTVRQLNADLLAPGATPGRLTLFSESAIEMLEKEMTFTDKKQIAPVETKAKKK